MKLSFLLFASYFISQTSQQCLAQSTFVSSNLRGGTAANDGTKPSSSLEHDHRILENDEVGVFLVADYELEDAGDVDLPDNRRGLQGNSGKNKKDENDEEEEVQSTEIMSIMLQNGMIYELTDLNPSWVNGQGKGLKSGKAVIRIGRGATISNGNGKISLHGGNPDLVTESNDNGNKGGNGNGNGQGNGNGNRNSSGIFDRQLLQQPTKAQKRNLAKVQRSLQSQNSRTNGNKTVLAVRIVAGDGSVYSNSESQLSDYVFGTDVTLRSQYKDCR